jgi:flagellar hook-associated protein 1 FlgK
MLGTLNVAQSGLHSSQTQVENVMNNIANENTPGYKTRTVNVEEAKYIDDRITGRGTSIMDVTRATNLYLQQNLIKQNSIVGEAKELTSMLDEVENIFYETDVSGLSNDLNRYFESLENLRISPHNEIYKDDLINKGNILVDNIKSLYSSIEDLEAQSLEKLEVQTIKVNDILQQIGIITDKIKNQHKVTNDMLDKRDALEEELSKYVNIKVSHTPDYNLKINDADVVKFYNNTQSMAVDIKKLEQKDVYVKEGTNDSNIIDTSTWGSDSEKDYYIEYTLNNDISVRVTDGEVVKDSNGNTVYTVDKDNALQALIYKINNTPVISAQITAWNGQYNIDDNGNKIAKTPTNKDHYLIVESNIGGDKGKFESRILVYDESATQTKTLIQKDNARSKDGKDEISIQLYGSNIEIKSGSMAAILDNINTQNSNNKIVEYKNKLDAFVAKLANMSNTYIRNEDGTYIYGTDASLVDKNSSKKVDIELFTGSTVDSLEFNGGGVYSLTQENLDYLTDVRWKNDIDFDGDGNHVTSFDKYYQELRVSIARDAENITFEKDTQEAVQNALQTSYDKVTKVDSDEQMIELMKFQSAYSANAKMITVIDEMLQTLLNLKK